MFTEHPWIEKTKFVASQSIYCSKHDFYSTKTRSIYTIISYSFLLRSKQIIQCTAVCFLSFSSIESFRLAENSNSNIRTEPKQTEWNREKKQKRKENIKKLIKFVVCCMPFCLVHCSEKWSWWSTLSFAKFCWTSEQQVELLNIDVRTKNKVAQWTNQIGWKLAALWWNIEFCLKYFNLEMDEFWHNFNP